MITPPVSRRTVAKGSLWTVPVLTMASAAPATAASASSIVVKGAAPVAYVGESVSQAVTATGGSAPYTWSVTGGQIAPGTTLAPSGTITGVPTAAGSFTSTALAKDTTGSTGTGPVTQVVGANRTDTVATMLSLINARRASIGVGPLTLSSSLSGIAATWAQHLTDPTRSDSAGNRDATLVHQNPLPSGVHGENLSATCSSTAPTGSPTIVGTALTNGWLTEPHSYSEWAALNSTNPALAQEMYSGLMPDPSHPGKYITSTTYPKASGHRINLENPGYTQIGLADALSQAGSACTPSTTFGYYGVAEFA